MCVGRKHGFLQRFTSRFIRESSILNIEEKQEDAIRIIETNNNV